MPAHAHAKLSFRLAAGMDPAAVGPQFERWLEQRHADGTVPAGITATATFERHGVRPCLTPLDHPALTAVTRAMARAFGQQVLVTREGGSGPEADLADILGVPVVFLGVGLPDDRIHAPNEKADIEFLLRGAAASAYLWADLAATWTDA